MTWMFIVFGILLVVGIIFFSGRSPVSKGTREEFLRSLAAYLESELHPIDGSTNSYRILFRYEGQEFIYEDIEGEGFINKVYNSRIRAKTLSDFTLSFAEKKYEKLVRPELRLASEMIYDANQKNIQVQLSKELSIFNVVTNDPMKANKLLKDKVLSAIFAEYKNIDGYGHPFMSLNILEGEVILEFHPSGTFNPRPLIMHYNMHSLEDYLQKMLIVINKLKYE